MSKYTVYKNEIGIDIIIRDNNDGTISSFNADETNSDYQAYLATLASESANDPAGNL